MIDLKALHAQQRADALARVELLARARKPVKSKHVRDVTELEQRVGVYIDNSRSQVRFYAALPDGREVVGAAFEHVEAAVRWCIRDTYELDWRSFIHIKRVRADSFGSSRSEVRPVDAKKLLLSGEPPPSWVFPGAGMELTRLHLAKRPSGDWVYLDWDRLDRGSQDSWQHAQEARQYHGITPEEGVAYSDPIPGYKVGREGEALLPYEEGRWAELSDLVLKLRTLHLHVAALFADDGTGRKALAGRLLDGLPLFGSTPLLGGPTKEFP